MLNTDKKRPLTNDLERAEKLRKVIDLLHEANKSVPVIVEGKKDAVALKQLGLSGEMIILHRGKGLYEFCEDIAGRFAKVILLMDWDTRGERLYKSISESLVGHWEEFASLREILKILCRKDINDIEGIPKLLSRLEGNEHTRQGG